MQLPPGGAPPRPPEGGLEALPVVDLGPFLRHEAEAPAGDPAGPLPEVRPLPPAGRGLPSFRNPNALDDR